MIPNFDNIGNLPPGIWIATFEEVYQRFAITEHRAELLTGLALVIELLRESNCSEIFLDGSFITSKKTPAEQSKGIILIRLLEGDQ